MTRESDREDFALLRDKILLGVGIGGILIIALAAVFVDIKNPELALAALTICGGLLGAPTFLRYDEKKALSRERGEDEPEK